MLHVVVDVCGDYDGDARHKAARSLQDPRYRKLRCRPSTMLRCYPRVLRYDQDDIAKLGYLRSIGNVFNCDIALDDEGSRLRMEPAAKK